VLANKMRELIYGLTQEATFNLSFDPLNCKPKIALIIQIFSSLCCIWLD